MPINVNVPIHTPGQKTVLEFIQTSETGTNFVSAKTKSKFVAWGLNYDHDDKGRLIEDYWHDEWPTVVADFKEMKDLGANVIRIHLQIGKFMNKPDEINKNEFEKLADLIALAEESGLYLNITGLGCYHKKDIPYWYGTLEESDRWEVQANFWEAVAVICKNSPSVLCYNLMNEPILPGINEKETEWLTGDFGGKHFVQRISLDLKDRTRQQVAQMWVNKLVASIRKFDIRHMITVGVIPWKHIYPNAKPLFYSKEVSEKLDFVSVHFYPQKNKVDKTLKALMAYDIGKPLVVEEMSQLYCSIEELERFVKSSNKTVDGYLGFYWGKSIAEYSRENNDIKSAIMTSWLNYFQLNAPNANGSINDER